MTSSCSLSLHHSLTPARGSRNRSSSQVALRGLPSNEAPLKCACPALFSFSFWLPGCTGEPYACRSLTKLVFCFYPGSLRTSHIPWLGLGLGLVKLESHVLSILLSLSSAVLIRKDLEAQESHILPLSPFTMAVLRHRRETGHCFGFCL